MGAEGEEEEGAEAWSEGVASTRVEQVAVAEAMPVEMVAKLSGWQVACALGAVGALGEEGRLQSTWVLQGQR